MHGLQNIVIVAITVQGKPEIIIAKYVNVRVFVARVFSCFDTIKLNCFCKEARVGGFLNRLSAEKYFFRIFFLLSVLPILSSSPSKVEFMAVIEDVESDRAMGNKAGGTELLMRIE